MSDKQAGRPQPGTLGDVLSDPNPVIRYSMAVVVVFGSLYVAQSYGFPLAWPIALLVLLGFLLLCEGEDCPSAFVKKQLRQRPGGTT